MTELIGKIFDRKYRLTRLIGEGGMGAVYEAEHTVIERRVAVKVMHKEFSSSQEVVDRFFREAQASSAIGHPNIIEIFDVGLSEDGTAFIVMELLEGECLSDYLKRERWMAPSSAVSVILQVLSALAKAHEKGIIHRDLKPDNIFLAIDNRGRQEVKLLDFGIAKVQGELEGDQGLTKTGTVLGTPNYMSPEQARGKEIDGRIDIWAAGVMLYQMLSCELPFEGDSYNAVLSDILLEMPEPIGRRVPNLPEGLSRVVEKAMEKDRDRRYLNVQAMMEDLIPFHDSESNLMTEPASTALKDSLAPPPAQMYQQQNSYLPDTTALTPDPNVINAMAGTNAPAQLGSASFRDLELGIDDIRGIKGKRYGIWGVLIAVCVLLAGFIGLTLYFKKKNESFLDAGAALFGRVNSAWNDKELSPLKRRGVPPNIVEPKMAPELIPPESNIGDAGPEIVFREENQVKIRFRNLPSNATVTLGGKQMEKDAVVKRSNRPLFFKIIVPGNRPLVRKVIPNKNQTILYKFKKKRKRRKKSNKK
jgi:serine/threonine protein kinase